MWATMVAICGGRKIIHCMDFRSKHKEIMTCSGHTFESRNQPENPPDWPVGLELLPPRPLPLPIAGISACAGSRHTQVHRWSSFLCQRSVGEWCSWHRKDYSQPRSPREMTACLHAEKTPWCNCTGPADRSSQALQPTRREIMFTACANIVFDKIGGRERKEDRRRFQVCEKRT